MDDFFGNVICAYTDADAVRDGVLIDVTPLRLTFRRRPVNRMTAGVHADAEGACRLQVPLFFESLDDALADLVQDWLDQARPTEDPEHWLLPGNRWLMKNETGGWTVMLPEDY